jgi:3-oxoacyl-[acyl-carrier protein] reductase
VKELRAAQGSDMTNISWDFHDRTVIVSGAARGSGLELTRSFAQAGAVVYMVDVDAQELEQAAQTAGGIAAAADVSRSADVDAVVARAIDDTGRVDIVVNNAGVLRDRMMWRLTDEDWDLVVAVSLAGTFRLTRACVPHFRERGFGRVVNVTSYTGLHGNIGQSAYAAAKAGVIGFTKTAAKELGRFGITVNAISPNARTRMTDSIPDEQRQVLERATPLGRFGEPEEMAAGVMFLASDEARYITGVVLPVDGGISM